MKIKNLVKSIAFLMVCALLFAEATKLLQAKWVTGTSITFMQEELDSQAKNTIDLAIIGSSQNVYGLSACRFLDEYGISAFSCSSGEQPTHIGFFYLRELCRRQDIKVVLYDVSMLYEEEDEARFRKSIDIAPWSLNKVQTIMEHCDTAADTAEPMLSYFFRIMKYHSRWNVLDRKDYDLSACENNVFRGNIGSSSMIHNMDYDRLCLDNEALVDKDAYHEYSHPVEMVESEEFYFRKMAEYCKANGIDLILMKTPKSTWRQESKDGIDALAAEYDLPYLDFNTKELLDATGIDIAQDFWEYDHINIRGADKLTDYLAQYLLERYDFVDGRKTAAYQEKEMKAYLRNREDKYLASTLDIAELLDRLGNDRYEVYVDANEDLAAYLNMDADLSQETKDGYLQFSYAGTIQDLQLEEKVDFQCDGYHFLVRDKKSHEALAQITFYWDEESQSLAIYQVSKVFVEE